MSALHRILVIEDDPADHALLVRELRARLGAVETERVDGREALVAALDRGRWDVVLSDYSVPGLPFEESLEIIRGVSATLPIVLVSGSLGEEAAVDLLKLGVSDFVLKDSLLRLGTAVRRAIDEVAAHEARERAEAALAQAQKLEAIGQLASGVAHDFNNLLSVIGTSAELALRDAEAGKVPLLDDLQQIKLASQRAALLTRQLLAFSRRQVLEVEVVDVRRLALDLEKLLRRLLPENISLRLSLENDAVPVMADPGQLEQVIVNLVVNARDAVGVRGKIELRVARVEVAADDARCASGMAPGAYASLAVSDDGCGMSEELQSRIFEPFFTTKAPGKGTGLGLSTVYGIVEQSGGRLEVRSAPGQGASFEVLLPRCAEVPVSRPTRATARPRGVERVLVVEDDRAMRRVMHRALEVSGYQVSQAEDGLEALEAIEESRAVPDLVITDLVMPRMDGVELIERLREKRLAPRRVLYMSGHLDRSLSAGPDGRAEFLQKPFDAASLVQRVRAILDA